MKWKYYELMTKKQKEKYNFKYRNKRYFVNLNLAIMFYLLIYLTMTVFLFVMYIIVTNEKFDYLLSSVSTLLHASMNLNYIFVWIMVIFVVDGGIEYLVYIWQEESWIKKHKLREKFKKKNGRV